MENIKRDFVISGIHVGEHSFSPDDVIAEIKSRCIDKGMNFVVIRPREQENFEQKYFIDWAKYLTENKIYFGFLYATQYPPKGKKSSIDKETIEEIKKIAGEYYMGDSIGETGTVYCCRYKGYYYENEENFPVQNVGDMQIAKDNYVKRAKYFTDVMKEMGNTKVMNVDASFIIGYSSEIGATFPFVETMTGNPELFFAMARGEMRTKSLEGWGTYIAHEWYGGLRHQDILKRKRLSLIYKYAYMAGSKAFVLESGDTEIYSYGEKYSENDEICKEYAKVSSDFAQFIKNDFRPAGGPKVKVAFVRGNLDGYAGIFGSSLWGQYDDPEWGYQDAEYSWKMVEEIGRKRTWTEKENYGENDLSANPAYGVYDIIDAKSSAEKMKEYEYLIFVGWNTMTNEIYNNLTEYVKSGGKLILSAAHLNTSTKRNGEVKLINNGDVKELFGCELNYSGKMTNDGHKFKDESIVPSLKYPKSPAMYIDPILSEGYVRYTESKMCGGRVAARFDRNFSYVNRTDINFEENAPSVIENKCGEGYAVLITSIDYPGNRAISPLYRTILREAVTASHRECDVRVYAPDSVRFSVYAGNKVYLLNTDYDNAAAVKIEINGKVTQTTLQPCELKTV